MTKAHDHLLGAYCSRATLARRLDMSESTVDDMVRRGRLPRPLRLSPGCVRWPWNDVVCALESLRGAAPNEIEDPAMVGARNVVQKMLEGKGK